MKRARRLAADQTREAEVDAYKEAAAVVVATIERLVAGDLDARVTPLPDVPELTHLRERLNLGLDIIDAFVRESGAALVAAAEGRYHRRVLLRGLPGAFREGARSINHAQGALQSSAQDLDAQDVARGQMVDKAVEVSTHLAAASTELGASARELAGSVRSSVDEASSARETVHDLERSSAQIQDAIELIKEVAARTRLLALNATIEAARAGEAGRSFAIVAAEVKSLADETARSSADITAQVQEAQAASTKTVEAIDRLTTAIHGMDVQVDGISEAAGGAGGLSDLAETLHADIASFADITKA